MRNYWRRNISINKNVISFAILHVSDFFQNILHPAFALSTSGPPVFRRPQEIYLYPSLSSEVAVLAPHTNVKNPTIKHTEVIPSFKT